MLKQFMIPVAAFALTVTAASAAGATDLMESLDLTDEQTAALQEAREITQAAREEARAVLEAAGLDEAAMQEVREAMHEARHAEMEAVKAAVEAGDFEAFKAATVAGPFADSITTEAQFAQLIEAHELREAGDFEAAAEIMESLGLPSPKGHGSKHAGFGGPDSFDGDRQSAETN